MLSYSNDQLALVNQCGVLSFHSSDSVIQYVAILCAIRAKLSGQVGGRCCAKTPSALHYPNADSLLFKCCSVVTDMNTSNGLFIVN